MWSYFHSGISADVSHPSLAQCARQQGRRVEAGGFLTSVYGSFPEEFDTADLKEAPLAHPVGPSLAPHQ